MAIAKYGGMAEWFKAAVLKTAVAHVVTGGSNPSPSALKSRVYLVITWGDAGVADRSRLLSGCRALKLYPGFESLSPRLV